MRVMGRVIVCSDPPAELSVAKGVSRQNLLGEGADRRRGHSQDKAEASG